MTDGGCSFKEKLALKVVLLKIDSIFEECSKVEERDKNALYEAIGNLSLQRIRPAEARTPADEMPVGFGGLTDAAAMDDFTKSSTLPKVNVNVAFPK